MVSKSSLQVQTPGKGEIYDRTFSKQSGKKYQMDSNMNIIDNNIHFKDKSQINALLIIALSEFSKKGRCACFSEGWKTLLQFRTWR